ncbi:hypothetical protein RJ640_003642 [Escallonia rubra]|uniref:SHSP domain-containing protein n=1 Tax=Escallonia rubra TaxID=112253 RepID=A0AA88RYB7_9ASTE|nr:hypothetical protein RJ640_003642 [Escallonia rubra]
MALIPSSFFGARRSNIFDPFSLDTAALANTRIDRKETLEAHVFKADLPGLKNEEVKVEVEEGKASLSKLGNLKDLLFPSFTQNYFLQNF